MEKKEEVKMERKRRRENDQASKERFFLASLRKRRFLKQAIHINCRHADG